MVNKVTIEYGNMVNVRTDKGELRIIFNPDGSFRLITNLPTINVGSVLKEEPEFGQFTRIVRAESFGHPFED